MSGAATLSFDDLIPSAGSAPLPLAPVESQGAAAPVATLSFDDLIPKQSLPGAVGNAAMQGLIGGAGQVVGGTSRMLDTGRRSYAARMLEAARNLEVDPQAAYRGLDQVQRGMLANYRNQSPERQAEMRAEWSRDIEAPAPSGIQTGADISAYGQTFNVDPRQEGVLTGAARMAGALPPALLAGGAGAVAGGPAGGIAALTAVVFAQSYEGAYQEALQKGATPEQATQAAAKNGVIQSAVNVVPLTRVLNNIPAPLRDKFIATVAKIGQSGLEFAGANALGRFAQNWVLREEGVPNVDLAEGVWEDAQSGAVLGALFPGAASAGRAAGRFVRRELGPATSPEFRADMDAAANLAAEVQAEPPVVEGASVDASGAVPDAAVAPEVAPERMPPPPDAHSFLMPPIDDIPTLRVTPEPDADAPVAAVAPDAPMQDVLPPELGVPAPDVAPAPDVVGIPGAPELPKTLNVGSVKKPRKPESAIAALIAKGGVRDTEGELKAMGADKIHHRNLGRLVNNKRGLPPDYAREWLIDLGYLPQGATLHDFYALIDEHIAGRPTYQGEYVADALEWEATKRAEREADRDLDLVDDAASFAQEAGIALTPPELKHAAMLRAQGMHPDAAVLEATRAGDAERVQLYNEARGMLSAREKAAADQRAKGAPTPEAGRARQELATVMQQIMRRAGLPSSVGLKLVDRLADAEGNLADGSYTKSLLTFALDTPPDQVPPKLFHEITHALMDPELGVLSKGQRAALERAAGAWLDRGGNRVILSRLGYPEAQMRDEAVARVAEEILTGARREPPLTTRAANAMSRAVEAIRSGVRGQGFWSSDGVFRAVMQGRMQRDEAARPIAAPQEGEREPEPTRDDDIPFARRPPLPKPEGPDLFGAGRAPAVPRTPEPTVRTDPRQETMPGMGPSAVQAQAARDQTGRGGLEPRVLQARADEGLFAPPEAGTEDTLLSRRPRGAQRQGALPLRQTAWSVDDPDRLDSAIRAFQDNKIDLRRLRNRLVELYGSMPDKRDAYLQEELYHRRVADRIFRLHDQRVKPILQKLASGVDGVKIDDLETYLHARHAPERNARMKEINPEMPNNEALAGMSDADAQAVMDRFEATGQLGRLKAIARDVDRLLQDTRRVIEREGLEEPSTIAEWQKAYQHYVPLRRDVEGDATPRGQGFNIRGAESKRAMGSEREVVDILANIVAQAETAVIRAEKNKVMRSVADMARAYPNDAFWKIDTPPQRLEINKETGLVEVAPDPLYQTRDNVVSFKEDGKQHFIVFDDKKDGRGIQVARALKNLDAQQIGMFGRIINVPTRFMASLLTRFNPEFWVTNFIRDTGGAQFNWFGSDAKAGRRELVTNLPNAMKGLHDLYRGDGKSEWAQYAREMERAGGTTGYMDMFETSQKRMDNLRAQVAKMEQGKADPRRVARATLEMIDNYNTIVENSVRLAAFQAARKNGMSTERAASVAKNITVNFNRRGNLGAGVNAWFMFFNASIQGTATLVNAAVKNPKARAALGGIAATGFLLDMVNRQIMGADYDDIPDWEKSHNAIFSTGGGEYVKIPYPLGLNAIANLGRLTSEALSGRTHKSAGEYGLSVAGSIIDAFNPLGSVSGPAELFVPSVARPFVQLYENKSFTGAPVYKSGDRGPRGNAPEPAWTRHFENTPEAWKAAARGINALTGGDRVEKGLIDVSPDALRHIFTAFTGGLGRGADRTLDYMTGSDPSPSRLPFLGRVYGTVDERMKQGAYYRNAARIGTAINEVDFLLKAGRREAADAVLKRIGAGSVAEGERILDAYRAARRITGRLNAQTKKIEQDDPDAVATDTIKYLRNLRMNEMNRAVKEGRP